jgi:hypothetical protein
VIRSGNSYVCGICADRRITTSVNKPSRTHLAWFERRDKQELRNGLQHRNSARTLPHSDSYHWLGMTCRRASPTSSGLISGGVCTAPGPRELSSAQCLARHLGFRPSRSSALLSIRDRRRAYRDLLLRFFTLFFAFLFIFRDVLDRCATGVFFGALRLPRVVLPALFPGARLFARFCFASSSSFLKTSGSFDAGMVQAWGAGAAGSGKNSRRRLFL